MADVLIYRAPTELLISLDHIDIQFLFLFFSSSDRLTQPLTLLQQQFSG